MRLVKARIGNLIIRNGLVVFQFTVAVVLMICTFIVFQQLKFEQNKDLGLNKENVVQLLVEFVSYSPGLMSFLQKCVNQRKAA